MDCLAHPSVVSLEMGWAAVATVVAVGATLAFTEA
jgi:hypothetical protein